MRTFEIFVPQGWLRLDLVAAQDERHRLIDLAVRRMLRGGSPDEQAPIVARVVHRLRQSTDALADGGAACLLLPLASVDELPLRPLVVMMPLEVPSDSQPMDALLAVAASDATAQVIDVNDLVALRTEARADVTKQLVGELAGVVSATSLSPSPTPTDEFDEGAPAMTSTRVRYLIGDPSDRQRWVDVYFSLDHPDHPLIAEAVEAATAMFDELVLSFRWTS